MDPASTNGKAKRPKFDLGSLAQEDVFGTDDEEEYIPLSQTDNTTPSSSRPLRAVSAPARGPPPLASSMVPHESPLLLSSESALANPRTIHDRIHSAVYLEPLLVAIVDTPQFQRLRDLKQLGGTNYVYPSACHTRFEHCIGVSHLAGLAIEHLMKMQGKDFAIDERDRLCIKVAGLCHDLGHGPFSHTFEHFVNPIRKERGLAPWEHEDMSLQLLDTLLEQNHISLADYGLDPSQDLAMIKLMICGLKPEKAWPAHEVGRPESKRFLLDIVANKRNGLDVDKFDYFVRDSICAMGAPPIQCDIQRIIRSSRIINVDNQNQICYEEKMALQLIDLFKLRAWLHKFVYQHHTVNCIEEMICDALRSADEPFMSLGFLNCDASRLSEAVDDVEAFSRMGDWLLNAIEASSAPTLAESRDVLFRLRQRSLYLSVAVPTDLGHEHLRTKTEQEILSEILTLLPTDANKEHCKRDLLVHFTSIDFGSRDERGRANNPIHKIRFYNPKINADVGFQLKRRMPDMLMPRAFSEKLLYVYSRSDESFDMLDAAYRRWRDMIHRRVERFEATAAPPQTPPTSDSMLTPVATGNQPSPMRHAIRLRRTQSRQQATSSVALRKFNST